METTLGKVARVITTKTCKLWLREDGILHAENFAGADESLADAQENIAGVIELAGGRKRPIMVDLRKVRSQEREARAYYGGEEASTVLLAAALLVNSALTRMIANFYMGLNKTRYPLRMFTSEAEALSWLSGFLSS